MLGILNDYGDAFGWPFRDPAWSSKLLMMGLFNLIWFITIVGIIPGVMNLLGYLVTAREGLQAGSLELPPARFAGYLGRGVNLFLVLLVYGLGTAIVVGVLFALGSGLMAAGSRSQSGQFTPVAGLGVAVLAVGYLAEFGLGLGVALISPIVYTRTIQGGVGAGLDFPAIWDTLTRNFSDTVIAALVMLAVGFIAGLGWILCCVGLFATITYQYAATAGVLTVFERRIAARAAGSPQHA